jgi:hypothetical protein
VLVSARSSVAIRAARAYSHGELSGREVERPHDAIPGWVGRPLAASLHERPVVVDAAEIPYQRAGGGGFGVEVDFVHANLRRTTQGSLKRLVESRMPAPGAAP